MYMCEVTSPMLICTHVYTGCDILPSLISLVPKVEPRYNFAQGIKVVRHDSEYLNCLWALGYLIEHTLYTTCVLSLFIQQKQFTI